ncbi:hypothetical protein RB599_010083 [Gaeumannomyces hyphopodioides]
MAASSIAASQYQLLTESAHSLGKISVFLAGKTTTGKTTNLADRKLHRFCKRLGPLCFVIHNTPDPHSELVTNTLDRFESILSVAITNTPSEHRSWGFQRVLGNFTAQWSGDNSDGAKAAPYPTLLWLNEQWKRCRGNNDGAKLEFAKKCLGYGSTLRTTDEDELFAVLEAWREHANNASHSNALPNERAQWDPPSLAEQWATPPLEVWRAARSVFQALEVSAACGEHCSLCREQGLLAKLRVATQRNSGSNASSDGDYFVMLIVDEERITETHVRAIGSPEGKPSKKVAFATESKGKTVSAGGLCQLMKSVMRQHQRLELVWENNNLRKLKSQTRTLHMDNEEAPVTLEWLLSKADLSGCITLKRKYILAVLLGYAVLNLHDTPWLQATFDPSGILFFPITSSRYHLKPFLTKQLRVPGHIRQENQEDHDDTPTNGDDPENETDPDILALHPVPTFITLAATLMELYLQKPFDVLAKRYCSGQNPEKMSRTEFFDVAALFDEVRKEKDIPDDAEKFARSIETCLDRHVWMDGSGEKLADPDLRRIFYNSVVRPLEEQLCRADNGMSIDRLDALTEDIYLELDPIHRPPRKLIHSAQRPTAENVAHSTGRPSEGRAGPTDRRQRDPDAQFFDGFDDPDEDKRNSYKKWKSQFEEVRKLFFDRVGKNPQDTTPVKIAVLDTGIDLDHEYVGATEDRIIGKCNWTDTGLFGDVEDENGHGTFVAGLLLGYARDAEVYVGKVSSGREAPSQCLLAKAIEYAIKVWKVDIISISIGYPEGEDEKCKPGTCGEPKECKILKDTIFANSKDVLIFAAASNGGANQGRAYPASDDKVICIHSTSGLGRQSDFSPDAETNPAIATVGEAVESWWPNHLFTDPDPDAERVKHKSGTSFATPIAVGMAANLIRYSRAHLGNEKAEKMKDRDKMKRVLETIARDSTRVRGPKTDRYDNVHFSRHSHNFFGGDEDEVHRKLRKLLSK